METKKWVIDPSHSEVNFKVKHLMISTVTGSIDVFDVNVDTNNDNFENATISFEGDMATINTRNEQRDNHLRSADFFDVEKYPKLSFHSTSVKRVSDDQYKVSGDLTVRGITKSIEFTADFGGKMKDPWGNSKAGFSFSTQINREDFGLTWNAALETGGVMVGKEVRILAEIQLLEKVEVPA